MVTRRMDIRKGGFNPIPISYLIQTANQFDCDIFVTNESTTANMKHYDEMKRLNMCGFLTFCFKEATRMRQKTEYIPFYGKILTDK